MEGNEGNTSFTRKLYFQGQLVASNTINKSLKPAYAFRLGYGDTADYYKTYDEMFISKPLTDAEIQYIYNSGNGRSWDDL